MRNVCVNELISSGLFLEVGRKKKRITLVVKGSSVRFTCLTQILRRHYKRSESVPSIVSSFRPLSSCNDRGRTVRKDVRPLLLFLPTKSDVRRFRMKCMYSQIEKTSHKRKKHLSGLFTICHCLRDFYRVSLYLLSLRVECTRIILDVLKHNSRLFFENGVCTEVVVGSGHPLELNGQDKDVVGGVCLTTKVEKTSVSNLIERKI